MSQSSHLKREVVVGGVSNAIFNGLIAWLTLRSGSALSWQGDKSFVPDVIATAFILPLIVALIVIPLQRRKLNAGVLQPMRLAGGSIMQFIADRLPGHTLAAALAFGLIGAAVVAPVTLLGLYFAGANTLTPGEYSIFKGLWAGAMAALLVVPMVLIGLRSAPESTVANDTANSRQP